MTILSDMIIYVLGDGMLTECAALAEGVTKEAVVTNEAGLHRSFVPSIRQIHKVFTADTQEIRIRYHWRCDGVLARRSRIIEPTSLRR